MLLLLVALAFDGLPLEHGLNAVLAVLDRFNKRWRFCAHFAYFLWDLITFQGVMLLVVVRLNELCECRCPGLGGWIEPSFQSILRGENDGLAVMQPAKVGTGIGRDDGECPERDAGYGCVVVETGHEHKLAVLVLDKVGPLVLWVLCEPLVVALANDGASVLALDACPHAPALYEVL